MRKRMQQILIDERKHASSCSAAPVGPGAQVPNDPDAKRTRSNAGFTLIELLAALAILTVLGTIVASAMITGSRVMTTSTTAANASMLEQSINTALTDVLRYASAQVPAGQTSVDNPTINTDSYTDYSGAAVRNGSIGIVDDKLALTTSGGTQSIPKASGIYTDFTVSDFQMTYDCTQNLFTGSFVLSAQNGNYTRECNFACRSLVDETTA